VNAIAQSFGEMNKAKLGIIAAVGVALLGFFVFLSMRASTPDMSPLFNNISLEDGAQIVEELDKMNIPYELNAGGRQVSVPADKVDMARVMLAGQGLPSDGSGIGYEIFDNADALGTSNFVLNVNKLRALEGELARTIGTIKKVASARVHLVIPKRELFTRDKREPTASVILNLRGATELEKNEVNAIKHLVATSVTGLKPTRITIVDSQGRMLAKGVEDENDPEVLAAASQEFRTNYERKLTTTIESLLERSVGYGKVKAEVNADIDFDRIVTNSEKFDPEGQVARSIQSIEENEQETEKKQDDNVSVANNLPDKQADSAGINSNRNMQRTDETTNYEISKTVKNHVRETGKVNRLSIAVLVDGIYAPNAEGVSEYRPRTEEELQQLETLVKSAVGYDADRGDSIEVVNMQFTDAMAIEPESAMDWLKRDFGAIFQTLVLAAVAVLVILLIIRPLVNKAVGNTEADAAEEAELQKLLSAPSMAGLLEDFSMDEDDNATVNIDKIDGGVKSSLYRKINDLIENNPEESLTVLRSWAYENENS
jgi:flagellar M-ring protein FliF